MKVRVFVSKTIYIKYISWNGSKQSLDYIPLSKLKREESRAYLFWVLEEIKRDPSQFEDYNNGKGIIAVRQRFLDWSKSEEGKLKQQEESDRNSSIILRPPRSFEKTIIVPIGIPGCGKTSVAVALKTLFNFAHVQSDDIFNAKKITPKFVERVNEAKKVHNVVIADM